MAMWLGGILATWFEEKFVLECVFESVDVLLGSFEATVLSTWSEMVVEARESAT